MNFKSFGYLNYDPNNLQTRYRDWWLLLRCDEGLTAYYRWWIEKEFGYSLHSSEWLEKAKLDITPDRNWSVTQHGVKTTRSAWGSHISVVRGEMPPNKEFWKRYQNKKVWFEYNPEYMNHNGKHWWIRAYSPQLEEIRQELGLTSQPTYIERRTGKLKVNPFHLTIGHMLN